jgi:hypothetical protein
VAPGAGAATLRLLALEVVRGRSTHIKSHKPRPAPGPDPSSTTGYGAAMPTLRSLRDKLLGAISKGEVVFDPDEVVEAGSVGTTQGPIVVARLDEIGIRATTLDHRVGGDAMNARTKIMVQRRDYQRAAAFIAEFTREYPSRNVIDY